MKRLRISAISYLNTAPLMWDFEHGSQGTDFDISYTIPSECAASLRDGSADIGIIPAAAYATIRDLVILPGVAIASRQPVRSILLVSRVPLEKIRSVALDTSSMTSVALTRILFAKWWGGGRYLFCVGSRHQPDAGTERCWTAHRRSGLADQSVSFFTYDLAENGFG